MTQRILSISGLRGVVGDGLDPEYIVRFTAAVGTMAQGGSVVVAQDGRATGAMVKPAVVSALLATGCHVVDAGIASTPTCGVLVTHLSAAGGLQMTASHNPAQWNGLKPFSSAGSVFDAAAGRELLDILDKGSFDYAAWNRVGDVEVLDDPSSPHLEKVLGLVDVNAVRARKLKVVLDCNHGSGSVLGPRMLQELGCDVYVLGETPDGCFDHEPEPLKQNLESLCRAVVDRQADVGFAQDPDADRLAIVDETGRYLGEELTLALCAEHVLSRTPGPLIVNGSTSRVSADIAARYNCPFHRSYVGEAHVVARMKEVSAILGGEGNGGVIEPRVGFVRDSFVGMAYVVDALAAKDDSLSEWADSLPEYTIVKDKLTCPSEKVTAACEALRSEHSDATPTEGDGLRLDWNDRWLQVRASNTEPILRVIAEAPEESAANELCRQAMDIVKRAVTRG